MTNACEGNEEVRHIVTRLLTWLIYRRDHFYGILYNGLLSLGPYSAILFPDDISNCTVSSPALEGVGTKRNETDHRLFTTDVVKSTQSMNWFTRQPTGFYCTPTWAVLSRCATMPWLKITQRQKYDSTTVAESVGNLHRIKRHQNSSIVDKNIATLDD